MSLPIRTLLGATAALVAGAALAQAPAPATTRIQAPDGRVIGQAAFRAASDGVLLQVRIEGLTPGWHGMHFHATGDCSDPKFQNSGGHINHAAMKAAHGLLNPGGPDMGDLPNLYVHSDGTGQAQAFTDLVKWSDLTDADGSALVFHASADDHTTQPIGGAGPGGVRDDPLEASAQADRNP
jgi:Cu-Zn family superoxide dismutase